MRKLIPAEQQRQRDDFDITRVQALLDDCNSFASDWLTSNEIGWAIRESRLPTVMGKRTFENYDGEFYVDNKINQAQTYLQSMMESAELGFQLQTRGPGGYLLQELFESEIGQMWKQMEGKRVLDGQIAENWYSGIAPVRLEWIAEERDSFNLTGSPAITPLDPRRVRFDPVSARRIGFDDARYVFQIEPRDIVALAQQYPDHSKLILSLITGTGDTTNGVASAADNLIYKGSTDVVSYLYRVYRYFTARSVHFTDQNEIRIFPAEDVERELSGYNDEQMIISDPFEARVTMWFEARYIHRLNLVIQPPTYIGPMCPIVAWTGKVNQTSSYPVGYALSMLPMQEYDVILTTMLMQHIAKLEFDKPAIFPGLIKNYADYVAHGDTPGFQLELDIEFLETHPDLAAILIQNPIIPIKSPTIAPEVTLAHQMILGSIKDQSGVSDTARGEPQYSGQSGDSIRRLQAAASTYMNTFSTGYKDLTLRIGKWLMWAIEEYRNFPHPVRISGTSGTNGYAMVADREDHLFDRSMYEITARIELSPEAIKASKRDMAMYLESRGYISPLQLLKDLEYPDPEKTLQDAIDFMSNNGQPGSTGPETNTNGGQPGSTGPERSDNR